MYYISFSNLIQGYFVPSSITCVNSMEVSYIPIAKARGFTTHWINTLAGHLKGLKDFHKLFSGRQRAFNASLRNNLIRKLGLHLLKL